MPLTVKVLGSSEPPMGVGTRESRAAGSLIPHLLTHSQARLHLRGCLSHWALT